MFYRLGNDFYMYKYMEIEAMVALPILLLLVFLFQRKFMQKIQWYVIAIFQSLICVGYYSIDIRKPVEDGIQFTHQAPPLGYYDLGLVFCIIVVVVAILGIVLTTVKNIKKQRLILTILSVAVLLQNTMYILTYMHVYDILLIAVPCVCAFFVVSLVCLYKNKPKSTLLFIMLMLTIVALWLVYNKVSLAFWTGRRGGEFFFETIVCYSSSFLYADLFAWVKKIKRETKDEQSKKVNNLTELLMGLKDQLDSGVLTQEEYDQQKSEILSKI